MRSKNDGASPDDRPRKVEGGVPDGDVPAGPTTAAAPGFKRSKVRRGDARSGRSGGGRSKPGDIREALEQEIVTGVHGAGTRLDEQGLADRFGVSRTPVREAIGHLASSGLVEQIPNQGAFVRRVGLAELVEMFEVMAELEAMAGRLAARRRSPAGLAQLHAALDACDAAAQAGDTDGYYYENERFHHVIYELCGNGFLAGEASRLHRRLKTYRRLQLRVGRRLDQSLAEHRQIVAAIASGDGDGAAAALHAHIAVQGERFGDFVASLGNSAGR